MRLRKLVCAVGLVASFGADVALGLGLGEIQLKSTINEPLKAEIKLLQVRDLEQDEIFITLAPKEEFQRAGVDRNFFLQELRFEVDLDGAGGPVVRVSTRNPVKEPYLNFLLETQWPSGRLLREYTLLMDLPVFDSTSQAGAVQGAQTVDAAPARSEAKPRRTVSDSSRTSSRNAGFTGDSYGPVRASDTLWDIALKVRPSRQTSVQQTMLAIQRLNPEAFINNNINLLRRGQVLRVPTQDDIYEVDPRQAVNEVAYQNSKWSDSGETGATLQSSRSSGAMDSEVSAGKGRLSLAAPGQQEELSSAKGSGDNVGTPQATETQLTAALEELDRTQRENKDLSERIVQLEQQIQTMERLVTVSNEEVAALEQSIRDRKEGLETAEGISADDSAGATADLDSSEVGTDTAVSNAVESSDASSEKPSAKTVVSRPPQEPSLLDTIMDNILYVGAAVLALIAAVVYMLRRRKEDEESDDFEEEDLIIDDELADDEDVPAENGLIEDESDEGDEIVEDLDDTEDEHSQEEPTESLTGDAAGEADIYIAYGKYDQAEALLLNALESEPNNTGLTLKLLEVYSETENLSQFDKYYAGLVGSADDTTLERADELRALIPNAAPFDSSAVAFESQDTLVADAVDADTEIKADDEFNFDLDTDSETNEFDQQNDDAGDFDFVLDEQLTEAEGAVDEQLAETGIDSDDLDLDFNLDDGSETPLLKDELGDLNFDLDDAETAPTLTDDQSDFDVSLDSDIGDLGDGTADWSDDDSEIDSDELLTFEEAAAGDGDDFEPLEEADAGIDAADLALDFNDGLPESLDLSESADDEDSETSGVADDTGDLDFSLESDEDDDLDTSADFSSEGQMDELDAEIDADLDFEELDGELDGSDDSDADFGAEDSEDLDDEFTLEIDDDEELEDQPATDFDLDSAFVDSNAGAASDNLELDKDAHELEFEDTRVPASNEDLSDEDFDLAIGVSEGSDSDLVVEEPDGMDESEESLDLGVEDTLDLETAEDVSADDNEFGFEIDETIAELDGSEDRVDLVEADEAAAALDFEGDLGGAELDLDVEGSAEQEFEFADIDSELESDAPTLSAEPEISEPEASDSNDDQMFDAALTGIPEADEPYTFDSDEDEDEGLDFLADTDEVATKLDLARAYIDMGDRDGAKDILDEVVSEGDEKQRQEAEELIGKI